MIPYADDPVGVTITVSGEGDGLRLPKGPNDTEERAAIIRAVAVKAVKQRMRQRGEDKVGLHGRGYCRKATKAIRCDI